MKKIKSKITRTHSSTSNDVKNMWPCELQAVLRWGTKKELAGWFMTLMMEAVSTSETSVNYQTTWHNIPEDSCLQLAGYS
jgi:hypothetical protein